MNHLQIVSLTATFDFDWPSLVRKFFAVQMPVANVGELFLSIDCFLNKGPSNSTSDSPNDGALRILYLKVLIMAVVPIVMVILVYLAWALITCRQSDKKACKEKAFSSMVIILFLVHPSIVQYMFKVFK